MESSWFLMGALGPWITTLGSTLFVGAPFLLYVLARWRARGVEDPQLGLKVALGYFAATALQVGLAGAAMLVYAVVSSDPSATTGSIYRAAFGLLIPAGVVLGVHAALLRRTNQALFPGVQRLLLGYNLVIVGLVGFTSLVVAFEAAFAKGGTGEVGKIAGSLVVVYGAAWAALGWRIMRDGFDTGNPPIEHVAPSPPPAPPTPGLPSLGGGAYPPIAPR